MIFTRLMHIESIMGNEIDEGRAELQKVIDTWHNTFDQLNREPVKQITPDEARRFRLKLDSDNQRLRLFYAPSLQDHRFNFEIESAINQLENLLEVSMLAGKRKYDEEMYYRKIETIQTWGQFLNDIKFNIISFIFGIISTLLYFFGTH